MAYVITRACCNDAVCVEHCPVDCIHPRPDEPGFLDAEQLYIDPATCLDCDACLEVCPVDAIVPEADLPAELVAYATLNARYFGQVAGSRS